MLLTNLLVAENRLDVFPLCAFFGNQAVTYGSNGFTSNEVVVWRSEAEEVEGLDDPAMCRVLDWKKGNVCRPAKRVEGRWTENRI